ncbi:MAG: hypothetical protein U0903_20955 [Planctomycetales bacterium]
MAHLQEFSHDASPAGIAVVRRSWLALPLVLLSLPISVQGADWMFAPSYYSHADSPAYSLGIVPQTRTAYRQPFVGTHPHVAVRGGWRMNNIQMFNGTNYDTTFVREYFIDKDY